jgi:hypothetical protein
MSRVRRQIFWDVTLLVLAIVSGVVVLVARDNGTTTPAGTQTDLVFPALSQAQPQSLALIRDGQTVHVKKKVVSPDASQWQAEQPWNRAGDSALIDAAVTSMRDLQIVREVRDEAPLPPLELRSYGLDKPRYVWQVELEGALWRMAVGSTAPPPRGGTYIEFSRANQQHRQVFVVSGALSNLDIRPEQLLEARLLPYVPSDIQELTLNTKRGHTQYRFDVKRARWFAADGQHRRISRDKFDELLLLLTRLKGQHFAPSPELPLPNLGGGLAVVELEMDKPRGTVQVEFYAKCDKQAGLGRVRVSGALDAMACADIQGLTTALERAPADWIDDRLFSLRGDEVESLTVNVRGQSLELEREGSSFLLRRPESRRVDIDTGNDVLGRLVMLRGELRPENANLVRFDSESTDFVQLRSSVVGISDHYDERILIGPVLVDGTRWVKRLSDGTLLRIDAPTASSLSVDATALRSRNLIDAAQ